MSFLLKSLVQQAQQLSYREKLQLIQALVEKLKASDPQESRNRQLGSDQRNRQLRETHGS